jgi:hypothetical protein
MKGDRVNINKMNLLIFKPPSFFKLNLIELFIQLINYYTTYYICFGFFLLDLNLILDIILSASCKKSLLFLTLTL